MSIDTPPPDEPPLPGSHLSAELKLGIISGVVWIVLIAGLFYLRARGVDMSDWRL